MEMIATDGDSYMYSDGGILLQTAVLDFNPLSSAFLLQPSLCFLVVHNACQG